MYQQLNTQPELHLKIVIYDKCNCTATSSSYPPYWKIVSGVCVKLDSLRLLRYILIFHPTTCISPGKSGKWVEKYINRRCAFLLSFNQQRWCAINIPALSLCTNFISQWTVLKKLLPKLSHGLGILNMNLSKISLFFYARFKSFYVTQVVARLSLRDTCYGEETT